MKSLAFPFMEPITLPLLVCNVVESPAVKFLNSMVPFEVCSIIFCVDCVLSVTIRLFEVTASMSCAEIFVKAMLPFVVAAVNLCWSTSRSSYRGCSCAAARVKCSERNSR